MLGKTDHLDLLPGLADSVIVPQSVAEEVTDKPDGMLIIEALVRNVWCTLVKDETVSHEVLVWDLGAGETQVIVADQRYEADRVVLDDLEARRCAKAMGFKVIGTLGIVARAKRIGRIDLAAPIIQRLRETGLYVSEDLVKQLLREVGE